MKILICDDEPLARERLIRLVETIPGCGVVAQAGRGAEAIEQVQSCQPDVVLLDVQMPGMNGLEAAVRINQLAQPPAIIFCTAYEEYAIAAFRAQAVGYLLKPVRQEALKQALSSAQQLNRVQLNRAAKQLSMESLMAVVSQANHERTHLSVRSHRGIELVAVEDIRLLKAEQKYVTIKTAEQEMLADDTLKELEAEFPQTFIRVHRNALVPLKHILGLKFIKPGYYDVQVRDLAETVPISRRYLAPVRKRLRNL